MNKHQEALDKLRTHCLASPTHAMGEEFGFGADYDLNHDGYEDETDVLQELVDKSKPRKVVFDEMDLVFRCPECGGTSVKTGCTDYYGIWLDIKFTHCSDCDQKLNWKINEKHEQEIHRSKDE